MKARGAAGILARLSLAFAFVSFAADLHAQAPSTAAPQPESSSDSRRDTVERLRFRFSVEPSTESGPSSATVSNTEADAPPPGVTRLPRFEVRDRRLDLTEREVLTDRGLVDSAKQRYLSPVYQKTFGQLSQLALLYFNPLALLGGWHPNDAEAMTLYEQDERLRRMRRSDDLLDLYRVDDDGEAIKLRRLLYDTYRHDDQRPSTHGHHDQ
jgi:hypothetical protein